MPVYEYTHATGGFWKLGKIRKGGPKSENAPGKDLDYFRVTYMPGKKAKELEAAFLAAYGPKPTEINVRFSGQKVSDVWDVNYTLYKQGGLYAQAGTNANGPYWIFYRDLETSEVLIRGGSPVNAEGRALMDKPIDLNAPLYYNSKKEPQRLELEGRLQVVIPELAHLEVGYFEFTPGSPRDLRNISAELMAYEGVAKNFGKTINGIPFRLIRREEIVPNKINGKLTQGPSWVVHLTASGEYGKRALEVIERLALPDIVEGEVTDIPDETEGPAWEDFEPQTAPQIPATVQAPKETVKVTPPAPSTPALPKTKEALMKIFSNEYNAAATRKIDLSAIPHINPKMTPEQITEAIQGLRAAVAASN